MQVHMRACKDVQACDSPRGSAMTHSSSGCSAAAALTNAGMSSLMCRPLRTSEVFTRLRRLRIMCGNINWLFRYSK
jgi:hypothetical protein